MNRLIYDPQARLYSTVSAYGKTWELTRIESDGTQHWQSSKQSAVVQKMVERDTEGPYAKHFPMQEEPLTGIATVNKRIEQEYGDRDLEQRAMTTGSLAKADGYISYKQPEEIFTIGPDAVHRAMYVSPVEAAIRARDKANKQRHGSKDPSPEPWVFDGLDGKVDFDIKDSYSVSCDFKTVAKQYGMMLNPAGHSYGPCMIDPGKPIITRKIF